MLDGSDVRPTILVSDVRPSANGCQPNGSNGHVRHLNSTFNLLDWMAEMPEIDHDRLDSVTDLVKLMISGQFNNPEVTASTTEVITAK